jgi:hypothetical protein
MIEKELLKELKLNMPRNYTGRVIKAYEARYNQKVSRWTIMRFFKGSAYSAEVHRAVLDVASAQQVLKNKTTEIING